MTLRTVRVDEVELCTEGLGDPSDPPVLLIMGIGASLSWWDEGFCRGLAERGRFVIRYDHRDTGRSTCDPPGRPTYTGEDLVTDAVRVLDGYGIDAAHLVGVSAGGGMAQEIALLWPERVRTLTLISTSPAVALDRDLPPPTPAYREFARTAQVEWSDRGSIRGYLLASARVLAGDQRPFGEDTFREQVRREVDRARDPAAAQNHDLVAGETLVAGSSLASVRAPALVVHGTADPLFPLAHGQALAEELPRAELLVLDGAGHGVYAEDQEILVSAIVRHTAG